MFTVEMESFAQQMLNEIDRRCRAYNLSNISMGLHYECNDEDNANKIHKNKVKQMGNLESVEFECLEKHVSIKENDSEIANRCTNTETIYANSNILKRELESISRKENNNTIPKGRKPALPPKPQQIFITKSKGFGHNACTAIYDRKSSIKKDPAEMSIKERFDLFEKSKDIVVLPKQPIELSISNKQNSAQNSYDQIMLSLASSKSQLEKSFVSNDFNSAPSHVMNSTSTATANVSDNNLKQKSMQSHQAEKIVTIRKTTSLVVPTPPPPILFGDLTPIVTTVAPTKMRPDETIGLNELHHQSEPNCSLLYSSNQYQSKDEDKFDKFIECLLFFCCVA